MKKQKLNSKLSLKKITISKLDSDQYQHIVGGANTDFCPVSGNLDCLTKDGYTCPGSDVLCNDHSKVGGICIVPDEDLL